MRSSFTTSRSRTCAGRGRAGTKQKGRDEEWRWMLQMPWVCGGANLTSEGMRSGAQQLVHLLAQPLLYKKIHPYRGS